MLELKSGNLRKDKTEVLLIPVCEDKDIHDNRTLAALAKKAKTFKADQEAFDKLLNDIDQNKSAMDKARREKDVALIKEKWPNAKSTASGLMYEVVAAGSGDAKPKPGSMVSAHYTGMFLDGRKFDSSVDRGEPIRFPVGAGRVIKGWDEALLDMTKGEKRILIIPPQLAYGSRGRGPIPPNSTLVFEVELIDF